jgi:23S rRNA pseudouridine1911/1915/1917 synthase
MKSVARGGQEAITRYRLVDANDDVSSVEVEIPTGRSHQIRAHFSEAGHPLLGDLRYGGPRQVGGHEINRQMLHASQLQLDHPRSGEKLDFVAELPYDMQVVMSHFFRDKE